LIELRFRLPEIARIIELTPFRLGVEPPESRPEISRLCKRHPGKRQPRVPHQHLCFERIHGHLRIE